MPAEVEVERVLIARLMVDRRKADCHPDREHLAKGLCSMCYQKVSPDNVQLAHLRCNQAKGARVAA